jgi:hypothetical protein
VKRKRLSRDEIRRRCHLQVPEEFHECYLDILCKHQGALSIDKYDLGLAKDFKHKIHLKTQDPVYRKQFKIPKAHHQFIEQTLDEWLKLGAIKRFPRAHPKLPYRQVLNEGDHRMHRRHRMGHLQHFHNARSDLRILADAAGRRFPEIDSFHHSRQGSVSTGSPHPWDSWGARQVSNA